MQWPRIKTDSAPSKLLVFNPCSSVFIRAETAPRVFHQPASPGVCLEGERTRNARAVLAAEMKTSHQHTPCESSDADFHSVPKPHLLTALVLQFVEGKVEKRRGARRRGLRRRLAN
jgi:hypothetical protein